MVLERPLTSSSSLGSPLQSRPQDITCDIAIVGGGIVGLTLACALKSSGLRVTLIDAKSRDSGLFQRRAYAITLMSRRILDGLGIWSDILPHITAFQTIRLADADCPTVVDLHPQDLGKEGQTHALGYVAEHHVLVQALHRYLDEMETLNWWDSATMTAMQSCSDEVMLSIQREGCLHHVRTRLLVAADGARSPIRHQAGISTDGWKYWQSCVTAVIQPEKSHDDIAREHFWPSGPFATLPLPGNRCQIVLTAPHTEAQRYMAMTNEEFLDVLSQRYQHQLGKLTLLTPRLLFPVQLMHSRNYIQSRLALVGDAAHCCHPVGGQGLNLGVRDAAALAQILTTAHRQGHDIGHLDVLKQYEQWRWWENLTILGFTDILDRSFSNNWVLVRMIRRVLLQVMKRVGFFKKVALWLMTGGMGRSPRVTMPRPRL